MRRAAWLLVWLAGTPGLAQSAQVFAPGHGVAFHEEATDRRFARSKLARLLAAGTTEPACVELLGGLFVALGEVAPLLHLRDEAFTLDPALEEALRHQLSTPGFSASAVFAAMVRRVRLDRQLPAGWFETAEALNEIVKVVDLAKLKLLRDGAAPIDSAQFTIALLQQRHAQQVGRATSAAQTDVRATFSDTFLDRQVAWSGAVLVDVAASADSKRKGELVATLDWRPPVTQPPKLDLLGKSAAPVPPVRLVARLLARQYVDLEQLARGQRLLVRGRLVALDPTVTRLELKDVQLFEDRDFTGVVVGVPSEVAGCPAAIDDLSGTAPQQPGGFGH